MKQFAYMIFTIVVNQNHMDLLIENDFAVKEQRRGFFKRDLTYLHHFVGNDFTA